MRHLQLTSEDSVFAITSAGDNVLHYAINAKPQRIHAVDMNPWCVFLCIRIAAISLFTRSPACAITGTAKNKTPVKATCLNSSSLPSKLLIIQLSFPSSETGNTLPSARSSMLNSVLTFLLPHTNFGGSTRTPSPHHSTYVAGILGGHLALGAGS